MRQRTIVKPEANFRHNLVALQFVLGLALAGLLCAPGVHAQQTGAPTAQQVLEQAAAVYESCATYMDTGRVQTIFISKQGRRTVVKPFSTSFVRPAAFRFEFENRRGEQEWDKYIVWKQGDAIKSWWSIRPEVKEYDDFSHAVAGATGVSNGSANRIPALLMPDLLRGYSLRRLTEVKLVGEEQIDAKAAYKLEAKSAGGLLITLWIDKERRLILRTFEKNSFAGNANSGSFETEQTTFYDPQVNADVPAARLAFDPPAR